MTRRYVTERRKQQHELAAKEAAARCTECKRPLTEAVVIVEDFLIDGKFCCDACLEQHRARVSR